MKNGGEMRWKNQGEGRKKKADIVFKSSEDGVTVRNGNLK